MSDVHVLAIDLAKRSWKVRRTAPAVGPAGFQGFLGGLSGGTSGLLALYGR